MDFGVVNTALQTVAKVINEVRNNVTNLYTTRSLSEITKLTRVEPLTILSKDCMTLDYMFDINQSLLSLFAGHYLQAIAIMTRVNDVEVVRILDSLNPDRDETGFLLTEQMSREALSSLVLENYKHSLPIRGVASLEAKNTDPLIEIANLSVGKQLQVEICLGDGDDAKSVKLPINIRLMVSSVSNRIVASLLTRQTDDTGFVERYHAWRSGRISFIRDLWFCQDLIDEYKRTLAHDESGTMEEIVRRVNNAKKYGLLTKNPSLVSASSIFVFSEETCREIEAKLGGKLSNPRIRQKAFENTYAMILVMIDRETELVTFYTRGISAGTTVTVKELKAINRNSSTDIADIMKSLMVSSPVSF